MHATSSEHFIENNKQTEKNRDILLPRDNVSFAAAVICNTVSVRKNFECLTWLVTSVSPAHRLVRSTHFCENVKYCAQSSPSNYSCVMIIIGVGRFYKFRTRDTHILLLLISCTTCDARLSLKAWEVDGFLGGEVSETAKILPHQ